MSKANILIVEDDDLMQGMLKDALSKDEYKVSIASDGINGWEKFQYSDFDLALIDLKLPGMDGITLIEKMQKQSPETIKIIMTAYGTVETAVDAMKKGAYDYITKPFLSEELILIVQKGLELRKLKRENLLLRKELSQKFALGNIIGKSNKMQKIFSLIETIAAGRSTILIQGESGTGKEMIAEAIHHSSPRKNNLLIKVSCAALPETLLESELFGHEKGAFTDAIKKKKGRFELAHQGTLFLDDVDDMNPAVQVKLLRVLQEREFERIGGTETISVDVRIIAASKTDLQKEIANGKFREDLFYRLNVVPIVLPPLRDRQEDIPLLVKHFMDMYTKEINKKVEISPETLQQMIYYNWPGNIRELENLVERLISVSVNKIIYPDDLPQNFIIKRKWSPENLKKIVQDTEKEHIIKVLKLTEGKKKEAASILGITPKTLWQKMKEYNIVL
jgi:DNA-binding NtrC family response regulator